MNYQDLKAALHIQGDSVSIVLGAFGTEVDTLLRSVYLGQSVVIREARPGPGDGQNNTIVISGRAAFLATPYPLGLPVLATFTLDEAGGVHALIQYTLVGTLMPAGTWKFSQSFAQLPGLFNYARIQPDGSVVSPLDELSFNDASFFVASRDCPEPTYAITLAAGLNFAGRLRPSDVMGLFQQILFGTSDTLVLSGPIVIPDPAVKLAPRRPLDPERFPWSEEVVTPVPGIMLTAPLNAKPLTLGGELSFQATEFRIYSPPSYAWLSANSTYQPTAAFLGKVSIPSAGIDDARAISLVAQTQSGSTETTLLGEFKGVTVGKLASLLDFAGSDSLIDDMPDPIRQLGDKLGTLELEAAKIELSTAGGGLSVLGTSATIGMPAQVWHLWPGTDHFDVSKIYARFDVANPFRKPSVDVTVGGTLTIEGVPIKLRARKSNGFTAYAELGGAQTIPLKSLMATYIPAVPPPSDLTIDAMSVIVAPGKYYSFTTIMAQQPHPWVISLGPKDLTISDVSLMLTYPSGGPVSGSFAGTIALQSVGSLAIAYDVPGALILRANVPTISLTDLAHEIADVTDLPFPPGFPQIDLVDSVAQFTRDTSGGSPIYDFILRTKVAIGSTPDFNLMATVVKSDAGTGFAAGIWTPNWAPGAGWTPGSLWEPLKVLEIDSAGLILSSISPTPAQQRTMIPIDQVPALQQDKFEVIAGVSFFASLRLNAGPIAILKEIFGANTVFSLFAALGTDQSTKLIAHLSSDYSKGVFTFNGFDLAWASIGASVATVSATARGSIAIDGTTLSLAVTGAVATDGTARLAFAVVDWVHPFGYQRLIVKRFGIAVALADGVTITLDGSFDFTTKKSKSFLFAVAGAITDFEAPSALAFALSSDTPNQMLKIGEVLEGITTIDIYDLPPETTVVPWIAEIKLLDLFLEIQDLRFWVVLADQVQIGDTTYRNGFGFRGDIALFGKPIRLYVEVEKATQRFAGSAEFPESIELGSVLKLSRPATIAIDSKQDLAVGPNATSSKQGPAIQLSSYIDAQHKYYLFVAAHVEFLDVIKLDILGEANNDGIRFSYDLEAGKSGSGAWASQKIDVMVSREKLACSAGLAYDFGLKDVKLGGFKLFGELPIPEISLPSFEIGFAGNIGAGVIPPKFSLGGSLKFSFMGIGFDEGFSIDVDLSKAPGKIADFGKLLLQWIKDHLADLLKAVLNVAKAFADWVKKNFEAFKDAAEQVANILKNEFEDIGRDAAEGLMQGIGFAESQIEAAVNEVYGALKQVCATTQAALNL